MKTPSLTKIGTVALVGAIAAIAIIGFDSSPASINLA